MLSNFVRMKRMINRYVLLVSAVFLVAVTSCVPAKKYQDLLAREKACNEELEKYKNRSSQAEDKAQIIEEKLNLLDKEVSQLKKDTLSNGTKFRSSLLELAKLKKQYADLEKSYDNYKQLGSKEASVFQAELEAKSIELQRKEDALAILEKELNTKQALLAEREARVAELEEIIARQDRGMKLLKDKIAAALRAYENKGLTVVEKDGRIYISLEAKLLFGSGSTTVEAQGKRAVIDLAKALENTSDLEIVVEGHTDNNKMISSSSPKNNWELSVLRATAVVEIMLGNSTMNPKKIMAAGRSEFYPVDVNDKAKNRRIEVIVSPNLDELFQLISK
jgi:chemotaxis protein MotB